MFWGKRVKQLRKDKRITQTKLAKMTGITHGTISKLERGLIKELSSNSVDKMAKALGVTTDYLLRGNEDSMSDLVCEKEVEYVVEQYHRLSYPQRKQLKNFIRFLVTDNTYEYED